MRSEVFQLLKTNKKISKQVEIYWKEIDQKNTAGLKELINKWGWPLQRAFGAKYVNDIWLLVQHADKDIGFQKQCLLALELACNKEPSQRKYYAYLLDRVNTNQNLPQVTKQRIKLAAELLRYNLKTHNSFPFINQRLDVLKWLKFG